MLKELFVKGGPVMYPLLACSLWGLACIIERAFFWWQEFRRESLPEVHQFLEQVRHGQVKEALRLGQGSRSPILRRIMASLAHGDKTLDDAMDLELDKAAEELSRTLAGLDTVITLSPLLGIFGTVTGIIGSFHLLGISAVPDPLAVSAGIAEALITTAAGLAIAMPALVFYNYFSGKSDKALFRLERFAREFKILYSQALERRPQEEHLAGVLQKG